MKDAVYIYSISCPITGQVRYIGKTKNTKERFRKHLSAKLKTAGSKWIFALKKNGLVPVFDIIDQVSENTWQFFECHYIKFYKSIGAKLLNLTAGGEGGNTMGGRKLTKEQANKISMSKIGKPNHATVFYNKLNKGTKVDQFNLLGQYIKTHLSIIDAAKSINRNCRRICYMVRGEKINGKNINHVGGFVFKISTH